MSEQPSKEMVETAIIEAATKMHAECAGTFVNVAGELRTYYAGLSITELAKRTAAALASRSPAPAFIDVVFDGPPSHESGRFVEVEDPDGKSIKAGEWIDRGNGLWALRLAAPAERPCRLRGTDCIGDGTSTSVTCTYPSCVSSTTPAETIGVQDPELLLESLIKLGPSHDGAVERDLRHAIRRLKAEARAPADRAEIVEKCAKVADEWTRTKAFSEVGARIAAAIRSLASEARQKE